MFDFILLNTLIYISSLTFLFNFFVIINIFLNYILAYIFYSYLKLFIIENIKIISTPDTFFKKNYNHQEKNGLDS
jgi:hypothetical protein